MLPDTPCIQAPCHSSIFACQNAKVVHTHMAGQPPFAAPDSTQSSASMAPQKALCRIAGRGDLQHQIMMHDCLPSWQYGMPLRGMAFNFTNDHPNIILSCLSNPV